jgi:hypothetical protein
MSQRWQRELHRLMELEPDPEALRRTALGERRPFGAIAGPPRRGGRLLAGIVAFAIFLAASSLIWIGRGDGTPTPGEETYRDATFRWSIAYPSSLRLEPITTDRGRFELDGIVLTNFVPARTDDGSGVPAMGWLRSFPDDGVALQFWHLESLGDDPPLADDPVPMSLGSLTPTDRYVGGSEPRPRYAWFHANGTSFNVAVWLGPSASEDDRAAIEDALSSIRFAALEPWTMWRDWYYVLGDAQDYPVGSVTPIPATQLPVPEGFDTSEGIYLVHAPGGFYAIPLTARLQALPACRVRFDPETFRFSCPGIGMTWDRNGVAIEPPPEAVDPDIGPHPVGVTLHGQVIYCPFFGAIAPKDLWSNV